MMGIALLHPSYALNDMSAEASKKAKGGSEVPADYDAEKDLGTALRALAHSTLVASFSSSTVPSLPFRRPRPHVT